MFSRARIGKHQWGCLHARRDSWWFDDHIPFELPSSNVAGWEMPELNEGWEIIELNVEFSSLPRFGDRRLGFKASLVCNPRAKAFGGPARVGSD